MIGLFVVVGVLVVGFMLVRVLGQNGMGPAAMLAPRTLLDDRFELQEGQNRSLSFHLTEPREVQINLETEEKPVNVFLFNTEQWGQFNRNLGTPFGSHFDYSGSLSQTHTMKLEKSATIPEGDWHLTIERPREALFFHHSAVVAIKVAER